MKTFIHFSVMLTNYPGGLAHAWATNSLTKLIFTSSQTSIIASFSSTNTVLLSPLLLPDTALTHTATTFKVLYSPFPVCFLPASDSHTLFSSKLLYYLLFPFSDDRLWQFILCRLEHFHLGFFLLGSVNNIYFTYKILNDMFNIVLLGDQQDAEEDDENDEQQMQLDSITTRLSKLLKGFLLTYCCSLVILFWIHFNIFAFHVDAHHEYTSRQFVAELPLWTLRWVTLGVAVADFATRGVYRWLSRITYSVDQEDVLSLPEN